jgi:hypothetical protein
LQEVFSTELAVFAGANAANTGQSLSRRPAIRGIL